MKNKTIIAIDVGVSGAVAIGRGGRMEVHKMPKTVNDIKHLFEMYADGETLAFVEHQQLRPHDLTSGRAFGLQKLLKNYNQVKGVLEIMGIPYVPILANTWQRGLNCKKTKDYTERKRNNKKLAAQFFPERKITLQTADAVLILVFAMEKIKNDPEFINERIIRQ